MKVRHGIMAMYPTVDALTSVMRRLRAAGHDDFEVFLPFPNEEVDELLPAKPTPMGWVMLIAGILGCCGAYFLQWYAARDYPLNVGGRPLHSWPSFIPVTFELTVLTSSLVGVAGLLWICGLPRLDYPTFRSRNFKRASQDRLFLCLHTDERLDTDGELYRLLCEGAESVEEVER
ncbi:MAG TPA: DUF3341 domain-containing protein [Opitutaceae bacterium]|nr:DUF3341 domain-containing protein [Opitutaceae bacterium]